MGKGILEGVVVLDLTRVLAGPYCGMFLADMGATVIKVERPGKGDDSRAFGPFLNGQSCYYMNLNRNKYGVTLNLKEEKGKEIFKEMVKQADVVIENYRPGTMKKLGLDYEVLKQINPRIVYGAVSGFGQYGPYSQRPGYDIIGQAMGGLMSVTGWPGGQPTRCGTAIGDVLGGLSVTIGVLGAIVHQKQTGEGQMVDVSLVDSVISSLEIITQIYLASDRIPERIGNRYESTYPYDSFVAKDGSVIIGCGNDKLWKLMSAEMGQPSLATDERYCTVVNRVAHHDELKVIVENWTKDQTVEQVADRLTKAGVPACPIMTIDKIVKDPHFVDARKMFVNVEHPVAGHTTLTGDQIKFSDWDQKVRMPAPVLGQHNEEVYGKMLGLTKAQIEQLKQNHVL
jgi:crotonobetainyl-CoA:carnitine CoA-transferase CaiB-like acyl-CoA transferase